MYKIEKGIEIPKAYRNAGFKRKYPFNLMKKGDSFLIPEKNKKKKRANQQAVMHAFEAYKRKNSLTKEDFGGATRIMEEGVRFWRTK